MSMRLVVGFLFLTAFAFAQDLPELRKAAFLSADSCQNVVRDDGQRLYIGFGSYLPRTNTSGSVRIIELADPSRQTTLRAPDGVVDIHAVGNRLFALTYSSRRVGLVLASARSVVPDLCDRDSDAV